MGAHAIDLTGKRFERLVVIERVSPVGSDVRWRCRCDCGKEVTAPSRDLKRGHTKSCGCHSRDMLARRSSKELTGKKFSRLLVLQRVGSNKFDKALWLCACDCGQSTVVTTGQLMNGTTRSCGCYKAERQRDANVIHGLARRKSKSRTYNCWANMLQRCCNPNSTMYRYYGGRGITVCERWLDFASFYADMGDAPPNLTIERKDTNGNYEPSNCKWADFTEQVLNRRCTRWISCGGQTLTITQWARETGIKHGVISKRIASGWSVEDALTVRPVPGNKKLRLGHRGTP